LKVNNSRQGDKTELPWEKQFQSPGVGSYERDTGSNAGKLTGVVLS